MTYPVVPLVPVGPETDLAATPTSATLQNAATSDGNGTDFDITGMATVQLLVNPTSYTGTITFWASPDGVTFDKIRGNRQDTTTIADNVANPGSTASIWTFQTAGLTKIRAVLTSSGGTSVTVTGAASPLPNSCPLGVTLTSTVLSAGTAVIGSAMIQAVSGTALAADASNTELRVSTYVKTTTAGDTALTLGGATAANSVPVVLPTDQYKVASGDGATASNVQEIAMGKYNGATIDRERIITKFVQIKAQAITASTPFDAYTPTSGKKFRILGYHLGSSANTSILFEDGTGNEVLRSGNIAANSGASSGSLGNGILSAAANTHIFLDVTTSATLNGWIGICEE